VAQLKALEQEKEKEEEEQEEEEKEQEKEKEKEATTEFTTESRARTTYSVDDQFAEDGLLTLRTGENVVRVSGSTMTESTGKLGPLSAHALSLYFPLSGGLFVGFCMRHLLGDANLLVDLLSSPETGSSDPRIVLRHF
jgi:hypothetical protein